MKIGELISTVRQLIKEVQDDSKYTDSFLWSIISTCAKDKSSVHNRTRFCIELERVKHHDCSCVAVGCDVLRTKYKVPTPIKMTVYSMTGDIDSIVDHCLFRVELMKYERVKWASTNYDEFINEHVEWSEKVKLYRSKIFNRKYDNNFKGLVEQTIIIDDDNTYYPVLLSNGSDYEGESSHQSNCVRTYENKPGSLIISLRKNSKIGERLTIEYKITKYGKEDNLGFLKRVQTKEKFNREPSESWGGVLNKLDSRIRELCMNKLFILPEVEIRFANNRRINTTIVFNEDGHPCFGEDQDIIPFIEDIIDELPL
jgi:hypothetical protein